MFCPILKDECNPECVLMTDQVCCIRKIAYIDQEICNIKGQSKEQRMLLDSIETKIAGINQKQDEIVKLLRNINGV